MTPPSTNAARGLVAEVADSYDDGRTTASLLARVREHLEPGRGGPRDREGRPAKRQPHAPAPVCAPAFALETDLHELSRRLEDAARVALGCPAAARGGSGTNTSRALAALPELLGALGDDHPVTEDAVKELRGWRARVPVMLGEVQPWPRLRGHVCPYCECASLRQRPADGAVVCLRPGCRDDDGHPREWSLEELRRLGLVPEDAPV